MKKRRTGMRAIIDFWPMLGATIMFLMVVMISEGMTPHHQGYVVDLALSKNAGSEPKAIRDNAMTVIVLRDGSVFFHNMKINSGELPRLIRQAIRDGAERRAYLRVDARAKYADVKTVVGLIDEAGIRDVTFLVEKRISQ